MAFHPFRSFQKHQRQWLAALTIFVMFLFILSGSSSLMGGDFFGWLAEQVGGRSRSGPEYARLYGNKVTAQDLTNLRAARIVANEFMVRAAGQAIGKVNTDFQKARDAKEFGEFEFALDGLFRSPFADPEQVRSQSEAIRNLLEKAQKTRAARLVGERAEASALQMQMLRRQFSGQGYFLGGASNEELLDFLVWRHQADRLGIRLSEDAVREQVKRETLQQLSDPEIRDLAASISSNRGQQVAADVYQALGDEFRVRRAREAILGREPALAPVGERSPTNQIPATATPAEFAEYYRKNRTAVKAALLPVPVKEFLAQVKDVPTEKQLKDLYDAYKEVEPSPEREKPAFKQPRQIRVEWVKASADMPYYNTGSAAALAASWATQAALHNVASVANEYSDLGLRGSLEVPNWSSPQYPLALHASRPHARFVASTIGLALGVAGTSGDAAIPVVNHQVAAWVWNAAEMQPIVDRERQRAGSLAVTTALLAGTGVDNLAVAATYQHAVTHTGQLPLESVQGRLFAQLRSKTAEAMVSERLTEFAKGIDERRGKPEELRKYIAENAKPERGVSAPAQTAKTYDQFSLADAPELQPLVEAYKRNNMTFADTDRERFAQQFFGSQVGTYHTADLSLGRDERHRYWRTEDKAAYVPKFEEARPRVEAAWKLRQARNLARKHADELAKQAQTKGADAVRFLRDEAAKHTAWGDVFELDGVSRLAPSLNAMAMAKRQYEPYQAPKLRIAYPTAKFADRLVEGLKSPGDAVVVTDRPETTYWVATLVTRSEPPEFEFQAVYARTPQFDGLWERMEFERQSEHYRRLIKTLRAEAGPIDEKSGRFVAVLEDRRREAEE